MRKTTIILCIIIQVLIFAFFNTNVYGAEICALDFEVKPQIEKIKDEVEIIISLENITESIVSVGFTLDYDKDSFEIENIENCDGWDSLPRVENVVMVYTQDYQGTDLEGNIIKIKLKLLAKDEINDFEIGLKNIAAVTDDGQETKIKAVRKKIEVSNSTITNISEINTEEQNYEPIVQKDKTDFKWIIPVTIIGGVLLIILIVKITHNNKKSEI